MPYRLTLGLLAMAVVVPSALGQGAQWGTVKGRVVFDGKEVPTRPEIAAAAAVPACKLCAAAGKTLEDEWVVDPKTRGVRWVMVWLLDESGNFNKPIPIHPKLKKPEPKVLLDQPCCMFEPHVLGIRQGQILVARNSATVAHNVNILGGDANPNKNVIIPAGKEVEIDGWKADSSPVPVQCTIHLWMNARIRVFAHPYFAVTNEKGEFEIKDAPAGKFRIVVWNNIWVVSEKGKSGKVGIPLEIKPDAVTDLGDIKTKPE
jgi:hypothetical protein